MTQLENVCKNRNDLTVLLLHDEIQPNDLFFHKNFS